MNERPSNAQVQLWIDRVVEYCGREIPKELIREVRRARTSEARAIRAMEGKASR